MLDPKLQPEEIYERREEFGLENSVKMLIEILDTAKDSAKRKGAIKYLGIVSTESPSLIKECFNTLENILVSEDTITIKCEAAKALGKLKYEKALKPLKWILEKKSENIDIKISALKAIRKIRFEEPEIILFINELGSENDFIKEFIKNQLLSLEPEQLIKILFTSFIQEKISDKHKKSIIKLIGYELSSINISFNDISYLQVKYPNVISYITQNKAIILEEITHILKEEDSELMDSITTILRLLGNEINSDLIKLILADDFIVKKNAIIISGKLQIVDSVDILIQNLDSIYNEVSLASIEALGEIGDVSAVPDLLDVLNIEDISFEYTDIDMKFQIIDAVKNIYLNDNSDSYNHLFSYIKKDNDTLKESIAFILGEIGKKEFAEPLINLLQVRNLEVKKNAAIALGKLGVVESIEHLIKILADHNSYWLIKKVATDAIFNIFQKNWYRVKDDEKELDRILNKNMALLIEYLRNNENENFKVKLSLIKCLETYGDKKALNALLKRVNDFHRTVRIHASNAIKKIEERLELENV